VLEFIDSFDHYATADLTQKWTAKGGTPEVSASGSRTGVGHLLLVAGETLDRDLGAQATRTIVAGVKLDALSADVPVFSLYDAATLQVKLVVRTDGSVAVYRGAATLLGESAAAAFAAGAWQQLEWKTTVHNTTGATEVRLNGAVLFALTAQNTRASGNNFSTIVRVTGEDLGGGGGGVHIDDLCVTNGDNTDGAGNTGFLGDVRVSCRLVDADGSVNQWTPSAGSRFQCVDEAAPNGDTDYVSTSTNDHRQMFGAADFTSLGEVKGVQIVASCRYDLTLAGVRLSAKPPASPSFYDSAVYALPATYGYLRYILGPLNPLTGLPWDLAGINGSEWGLKLEPSGNIGAVPEVVGA
jgi:hypothetical protein